jgi:hypothetical protein
VASLRATAGRLGLEPGSGALAPVLGEASVAAAQVLDAIIALEQVPDRDGSDSEIPCKAREPRPVPLSPAVGHLTDAIANLRRALRRLSALSIT